MGNRLRTTTEIEIELLEMKDKLNIAPNILSRLCVIIYKRKRNIKK